MIRDASTARRAARPFNYDDAERRGITREAMAGLWTLRCGPFGCRDDETAGGVLHIEGDRIAGGDGYFILHGRFDMCDGGIDVTSRLPGASGPKRRITTRLAKTPGCLMRPSRWSRVIAACS